MATEVPSYLRAKVKAAKERARQPVQAGQPTKGQPAKAGQPTTTQTAGARTIKATDAASRQTPKVTTNAEAREVGLGEVDANESAKMADLLVARSTDREIAQLARPHLSAVYDAILVGAKRPGREGSNDRQTLFKMIGLPGHGAGGRANSPVDGATDRLVAALSRVERRLSGHPSVTVTVDAEPIVESPPMLLDGRVEDPPLEEGGAKSVDEVERSVGRSVAVGSSKR